MEDTDHLDLFLAAFLYELEAELLNKKEELKKIKFQSEEANTDEFLKAYMKEAIANKATVEGKQYGSVKMKSSEKETFISTEDLENISIVEVLLPKELTDDQKAEITKEKDSVYTNPDLYLGIKHNGGLEYRSIELKSTKNNTIPGSSVQQVSPFEWVIFVKHDVKGSVDVTVGHYINSITEKLPFPDRSPRPQIGFNTLKDWNKSNRSVEEKELCFIVDDDINEDKLLMLEDWQEFLAEEWMETLQATSKKKSEKWFNNALRKFGDKFLDHIKELDDAQIEALHKNIKSQIE